MAPEQPAVRATGAIVTCKCIGCGAKKDVGANEIPPDEVPMCDVCMMPMVAESARAK